MSEAKHRMTSRLGRIQPSATVAVAQRARALRDAGVDVLSFSVGEPDFATPENIREAAKRAVDGGAGRYTNVAGIDELREAIVADSASRRGGVRHSKDEVIVSVGAKHTLYNVAMALFEEGDEVIIPAPYWVSYPAQVKVCGATPVIVSTGEDEGFKLNAEALREALTDRTRALILCTPSNPTGAAYLESELEELADVLRGHDCWIILDEIYAQLVYGGFNQRSLLEVAPDLKERMVVVDGVSKAYAMTGWRIGWCLAPAALVKACTKLQSQSTTNPTAVAQYAALEALTGPQDAVANMREAFEKRRALVVEGLNAIDGISCRDPEGAFYVFASIQGLVGKRTPDGVLEDDLAVVTYLLEEARCAFVPGSAFGAPGYMRMSYAASEENLREGLRRVQEAVAKLV